MEIVLCNTLWNVGSLDGKKQKKTLISITKAYRWWRT